MFTAKVDDAAYWVIENTAPAAFEKIKVFVSDNFYTPAAGKIKNLKIQTKVTLYYYKNIQTIFSSISGRIIPDNLVMFPF